MSRPLMNLKGDQTTIDQTSDIPQAGRRRMEVQRRFSWQRIFSQKTLRHRRFWYSASLHGTRRSKLSG
jgi:hypothetical protein